MSGSSYTPRYSSLRVQQDKSVFIMKVDADDLVSNQLVAFTERYPDRDGWYFTTGYIYEKQ